MLFTKQNPFLQSSFSFEAFLRCENWWLEQRIVRTTGFAFMTGSTSTRHLLVISAGPVAFPGSLQCSHHSSWQRRVKQILFRSIIGTSNKLFLEFASSPAGPLLNTGFDFRCNNQEQGNKKATKPSTHLEKQKTKKTKLPDLSLLCISAPVSWCPTILQGDQRARHWKKRPQWILSPSLYLAKLLQMILTTICHHYFHLYSYLFPFL